MANYLIEAQGDLTIKNGAIEAPERAIHIVDGNLTLENVQINAVGRCIGAYNDCVVKVDKDCELTTTGNDVCVMLYSTAGRTEAVTEIEIDGKIESTAAAQGTWAISGNGSANHGTTKITINEGAVVKAAGDSTIYHPQGGTITVNGGLVEGPDGIYMKSGKCIINGGTIRGTGTAETTYTYSGNGTETPLGHGIVMEFTDYPAGLASLEVNGGEITADYKDAIGYYVSPKCTTQDLEALKAEQVIIKD